MNSRTAHFLGELENNYRHKILLLTCFSCLIACTAYFIQNLIERDPIDAASNAITIIASATGLVLLKKGGHTRWEIHSIGISLVMLYFSSIIGPPSTHESIYSSTSGLLWCLFLIPLFALTMGHKACPPYYLLLLLIASSCFSSSYLQENILNSTNDLGAILG